MQNPWRQRSRRSAHFRRVGDIWSQNTTRRVDAGCIHTIRLVVTFESSSTEWYIIHGEILPPHVAGALRFFTLGTGVQTHFPSVEPRDSQADEHDKDLWVFNIHASMLLQSRNGRTIVHPRTYSMLERQTEPSASKGTFTYEDHLLPWLPASPKPPHSEAPRLALILRDSNQRSYATDR
ncbi:hypothetical protein VTN31DRAFT_6276 [Thermomyces dupontii]|uniref:uncharacterized protein n=1 Tax=Talaromyces thermophilus TaxID=28565 RepID=UPI003743119B